MSVPHDLADQIAELFYQLAELNRRFQNQRRTGTVAEVDYTNKRARVKLSEDDDGEPFLGPWMPWQTIAAGTTQINVPPSIGQQVAVVSESGDIADGVIETSTRSDAHPLPAAGDGEMHITMGTTKFLLTKTSFEIRADKMLIKSKRLKFEKG
jgi:hypothetical protein